MEVPWLLVTVLALAGLSLLAFALGVLDLLGSVASFLLGLLIALLGDLSWLALMVLFTGLGFAATRLGYGRKKALGLAEGDRGERGVGNVMGNGAAAGLAVLAIQLPGIGPDAVRLAYAVAVAAVTADTLASEIGALSARARIVLPPFAAVPRGTNGAVSWAGQGAALAGAAAIAAAAVAFVGLPMAWAGFVVAGGFLGCQLDSLLGATLESPRGRLTKQDVNFLASAVPAAVALAVAVLAQ
ncbi:MAG: hypothetical protein QOD77_217 [Thermoplasmata archaeon]|jgi:uncharacterized protein (TIGR00297 family)|nr:hypothetical protein [Thermoplasmata archaeon]